MKPVSTFSRRRFLGTSAAAAAAAAAAGVVSAPRILTAQKTDTLVVTDRANGRLQWFTLEGQHLKTPEGFILPANADLMGDTLLIPDLSARITLLDKDDKVITHLGEDPAWRELVMKDNRSLRKSPTGAEWVAGKFLHPHDACFDEAGNIFVAEWVNTGRISRLRKVG